MTRKQDYDIDELHLITRAAVRPARLALLAIIAGFILATLTYQDTRVWATGPMACISGAMLAAGALGLIIYGINAIRVAMMVDEIRRRHLAAWQQRADADPEVIGQALVDMARIKLEKAEGRKDADSRGTL